MKHSLLYTTIRPHFVFQQISAWLSKADNIRDVEIILVTDAPYWGPVISEAMRALVNFPSLGRFKPDFVMLPPFNSNRAWNRAAELSCGDILYMISDDLDCPEHWDSEVDSRMHNPLYNPLVLHTDDATEWKKNTHPIVSRKWYCDRGYFLYPHYMSMFDETELTEHAQLLGCLVDSVSSLSFPHIHPSVGKRKPDEIDLVQSSEKRMTDSRRLFDWRKANGFTPPKSRPPSSKRDYIAYLQVIKDDFCLTETVQSLHRQGVMNFFFHVPIRTWSGDMVSESEICSIEDAARSIPELDTNVWIEREWISPGAEDKRVDVETKTRNSALRRIRQLGYRHILVVDGDELWRPGAFDAVHALVSQGAECLSMQSIPIIGLPAYPSTTAKDKEDMIVYVGMDTEFICCRFPNTPYIKIPEPLAFHFSGTRRTIPEIEEKCRGSGHYDDSNYDFEGWIKYVLPNVRPGFKNAHMYKPYQIWPEIRAWTKAEMADIPESIHQYLGNQDDVSKA